MDNEPDNNQQPRPTILQGPSPVPEKGQPEKKPLTPEEARVELSHAIEGSNEVLASATTLLTIFSDTLTVDRAKLTVTKRTFWKAAEVMSIRIEDVLNVTSTVGPIFGSVKITSRVFNSEKPYVINHFWREDATRMKRITQGYVIALQRGIDCSSLPIKELSAMLDQLGEDSHSNQ
jgi:hypothetical protein